MGQILRRVCCLEDRHETRKNPQIKSSSLLEQPNSFSGPLGKRSGLRKAKLSIEFFKSCITSPSKSRSMFANNTEELELSTSQSLTNSPPTVGSGDPKSSPPVEVNSNSSFHNINPSIAYHGSIHDHRSFAGQDPKDLKFVPSPQQTHIVAHNNITFPQESYVKPDFENKLICRQDIAPSNVEYVEQNVYQGKDKTPLASWQIIETWHIRPQDEDEQCLRELPMSKHSVLKNLEDEMRKEYENVTL